jgi:hypothetical protein
MLAAQLRRLKERDRGQHMPEPVRVFISHSHRDDNFTNGLVSDLRDAQVDVWVDVDGITHDDFIKRINDGLRGREWLVLVMTPDALRSEWVQAEVNAALNLVHQGRMKGVIPLVAKPCSEEDIPPLWATLHRIYATDIYWVALQKLLNALGVSEESAKAVRPGYVDKQGVRWVQETPEEASGGKNYLVCPECGAENRLTRTHCFVCRTGLLRYGRA